MGSYEEEYRKYYLDTKAKLDIKSSKEKPALSKEKKLKLNPTRDIYPKSNYNEEDENSNYIVGNYGGGSYKGIGTYSGIDNYNNLNSYRGFDGYNGRAYYGYNNGRSSNVITVEENILGKWAKRIIIELLLTLLLFLSVIGIRSLPYKEAKYIYTTFKGIVNTNFDYKNFIDYVKTVDVMGEVDKIKENLKKNESTETESRDVNTFKPENNDENIDDITSDKVKESTD